MKRALLAAPALAVVPVLLFLTRQPPPPSFGALTGGQSAARSGSCTAQNPVVQAAYKAGFRGDDLVVSVAVAKAESGWNPLARNDNTNGSVDYGEWQINSVHADILAGGDWSNINDNAVMAHQVFTDAGSSWNPWVTFWSGSYRKFMAQAQDAVAGCQRATGLADAGPGPQGADGLRPRAEAVKAYALDHWGCSSNPQPCVSSIGGYARRNIAGTGVVSDHATGRAVDVMLPADYRSPAAQQLGLQMADFYAANLKTYGGHYVIFNKRIFSAKTGRWVPYTHPSGMHSDTLDHVNHVHVSVY